jgi:integrase
VVTIQRNEWLQCSGIGGRFERNTQPLLVTSPNRSLYRITKGAGNKTINTYFRYLNTFMNWCVVNKYLDDNPWRYRPRLKQKKFKIHLFTIDEFQAILNKAPDHLAWAMEVEYHTGVRPGPSELFALKWSDCDFEKCSIRIYGRKTDTWRMQYVDPNFAARMKLKFEISRAAGETSPYIITYKDQPVKSLKKAWQAAKRDAGIRMDIRMYDIRHFYITYALYHGANMLDLANRVGHTDPTMIIKVYSHLMEEMKKKQAFEIPKIVFPNLEKSPTVEKTVDQK